MELIPVKKQKSCNNCPLRNMCRFLPTEIKDDSPIDLLFIGEASGKEEEKIARPFVGSSGYILRSIIKDLEKTFNFNYVLTNIVKARSPNRTLNEEEVRICSPILLKEIKKYNPKVIICMGNTVHKFFHKKEGILLEEGCLRKIKLDKVYPTISTVHPAWCLRNYPGTAGLIYEAVRKALLYIKFGTTFNIPNTFDSVFLDTVKKIDEKFDEFQDSTNKVSIDTETNNLYRVYGNEILSLQFCNDGKTGYVIPYKHFDSPFSNEEIKHIGKRLVEFLTGKTKVSAYIFQNPKFDLHQIFRDFNILFYNAPVIDVGYNEYLLDENKSKIEGNFGKGRSPFSLYTMAYKRGFTFYSDTNMKEERKNFSSLKIDEWLEYASADVVSIWNIYESQYKYAKLTGYTDFKKMAITFNTVLCRVITFMEHCGLPIDIKILRYLHSPRTSPFIKEIEKLRLEFNNRESVKKVCSKIRRNKTGYTQTLFSNPAVFDPNKRSHREFLYFDCLNLSPLGDKFSTDKAFQEQYANVKEVEMLTSWNSLQKLKTGYIDNIYDFMNKTTGNPDFYTDNRIRSSYRCTTVTGRLKSTNPNGQQRPKVKKNTSSILSMYRAGKGRCLIKIDFSAFEVRGLGELSRDAYLIKTFKDMDKIKREYRHSKNMKYSILEMLTDIHRRYAALFNEIPFKEVSKKQRDDAKKLVFGSIYGRGARSIAEVLEISVKKAEELQKRFKETMPDANNWLKDSEKRARENLYLTSFLGRNRRLWGYLFKNKFIHFAMDRLAKNSKIQGVCSDLNIIASYLIIEKIIKNNLNWKFCNVVHDDSELDIPYKNLYNKVLLLEKIVTQETVDFVKKYFNYEIIIPLEVSIEVGKSFARMKVWKGTETSALGIEKFLKEEEDE